MKKLLSISIIMILAGNLYSEALHAQNRAQASQTIQLVFLPAIDLNINFLNSDPELKVLSNKNFRISVHSEKASSDSRDLNNYNEVNTLLNNSVGSLFNHAELLQYGKMGEEQTLALSYRSKSRIGEQDIMDVIYTATHP